MRLLISFLATICHIFTLEANETYGPTVPLNLAACLNRWRPHIKPDFNPDGNDPRNRQSPPSPQQLQAFVESLLEESPGTDPTLLVSRIGNCEAVRAAFNSFVAKTSLLEEI